MAFLGPRRALIGSKAAHVCNDLGDNDPCTEVLDTRDRAYLLNGGAKGRKGGLHLPVDFGNCRIEGIDLIEVKAQQEAVSLGHTAAQGLTQCFLGSLQPMVGQAGKLGRNLLTGNQRLELAAALNAWAG